MILFTEDRAADQWDVAAGPRTGGDVRRKTDVGFSEETTGWSPHWEELEADSAAWRASRPFWSSAFLAVAVARYLSSQQRDDSVIIAGTRLVPTAGNNRIRRLRLWFLNKVSCSAWRAAIPWLNPFLPLWLTVCLPTDVLKPVSPGLIHRPVQPVAERGYFSVWRNQAELLRRHNWESRPLHYSCHLHKLPHLCLNMKCSSPDTTG